MENGPDELSVQVNGRLRRLIDSHSSEEEEESDDSSGYGVQSIEESASSTPGGGFAREFSISLTKFF